MEVKELLKEIAENSKDKIYTLNLLEELVLRISKDYQDILNLLK